MEILPDELVCECLKRVPYTSHNNLKAVCKSWEGMMSSPHFYADRKVSGKSEQLICLIQCHRTTAVGDLIFEITLYDPLSDTWKMLPPIDDPHFPGISYRSQCVAVNRKLVLITGLYTMKNIVYIYDFESARWSRGADMPTPRSNFACSASSSNGLVYVAGGMNEFFHPLASAETYNVEEDRWETLPPMIQQHGLAQHGLACHGVFMDGKFMVLSKFKRSALVFDPSAEAWRRLEVFRGPASSCGPASCCDNLIYVFSQQQEEVMKYDRESSVCTHVASFPQRPRVIKCATEWRDWIFVSTCGSSIRQNNISYLFNPATGRWIQVNGAGFVLSATTLQI